MYDTIEHFWKTQNYNDVSGWLLTLLDNVARVKDELGGSVSQLRPGSSWVCPRGEPSLLAAAGLKFLKIKCRASSCN